MTPHSFVAGFLLQVTCCKDLLVTGIRGLYIGIWWWRNRSLFDDIMIHLLATSIQILNEPRFSEKLGRNRLTNCPPYKRRRREARLLVTLNKNIKRIPPLVWMSQNDFTSPEIFNRKQQTIFTKRLLWPKTIQQNTMVTKLASRWIMCGLVMELRKFQIVWRWRRTEWIFFRVPDS